MEDYITTLRRRIAFIVNVLAEIHLKKQPAGKTARQTGKKQGLKGFSSGRSLQKNGAFYIIEPQYPGRYATDRHNGGKTYERCP